MKNSKSQLTLALALACAAITFSLAVGAQAQTFSKFAIFDGTNGSAPNAVVQATDGNLYATTRGAEPPVEFGNVVRVSPTGEVTSVYTFCQKPHCADGAWPATPPILGSDGNLYGVTSAGGSKLNGGFGWGTVYKMTLTGQITTLHIFCPTDPCSDGSNPVGIMQASDGTLYGTTFDGGQFNDGTLFKLTTTRPFTIPHNFCSLAHCADDRWPLDPPI